MIAFNGIINYSPENKKVFEELSGLCINKMIVPYIGAGMSVFAGFKTWNKFIDDEYENCFHTKKPDDMNNIVAADLIEQKQGKDIFYENVHTAFGGNLNYTEWENILKKSEKQAISIIPKLFYGPIITTNFDQIIENIHDNRLPAIFPYNSKELAQAVDNRKRLVYKIHGCVSDAKNVVFTKSIYDKVYDPDSELVKSLSVFFQGFHFLFLGSSLGVTNTKGDTKDYSMDLWEKLQNSGTYHFAIIDCTKDLLPTRRKELEERNIYPILFESGKYESVKIILDKLLEEVNFYSLNIPQYTTAYTERKDSIIEQITNHLDDRKYSALALTGMGGVGKTRIINEYAIRVSKTSKYTEIIWFNAISDANIREEIYRFAVRKKIIHKDEKDPNRISFVFKRWMQENENWLFLLDNVEHYEDIQIFFDFDQTLLGKRHILMSSRLNADKLLNISILPIETFTQEEVRRFLHSHTEKEPDEFADKITEQLGGLPLALEQAAAYMKEENESYQRYFKLLEEEPLILLEKTHPESGAVPVRATWNISMQRIKRESAKRLLNLCAFFAPDNIHSQWFIDAINVLPDELQKNGLNDFAEIKKELQVYSLVLIDSNEKINMHRLLQEVVRKTLKDVQEIWIGYCMQILYRQFYDDFSTAESRTRFTELAPHILSVIHQIQEELKMKDIDDAYCFLGIGFNKLADYKQALEWFRKTFSIREKILGKEHSYINTIYNNIATIYNEQGKYEKALEWYQKSLVHEEKVLEQAAITYNNMAMVYERQGKYQEALERFRKTLIICEAMLGHEYPLTATTYNNIGLLYTLQGDYELALEGHLNALLIRLKIFGDEHPDTAVSYHNIALVHTYQLNYELALNTYQKALSIMENVLGVEHPDTANSYIGIAFIYHNQGGYGKSIEEYKKALIIKEKIFGAEHPDSVHIYHGLAEVYKDMEKYDEALEQYKKALVIREKMLGKKNIETAKTYKGMAVVYYNKEEYKTALLFGLNAFIVFLYLFGTEHIYTKKSYSDLQVTYKKNDNPKVFEEWLNEQLQQKDNDQNE